MFYIDFIKVKKIIIGLLVIFLSLTAISCEEADIENGDYCGSSDVETICQNDKLFICENSEYHSTSCKAVCAQYNLQPSGDCKHDSTVDRDVCWCESNNTTCVEGSVSCSEPDVLNICQNDKWVSLKCDTELCVSHGFSSSENKCAYSSDEKRDTCWCYY